MRLPLRLLLTLSLACVATLAVAAGAEAKPVWLCKPGLENNPCTPSLKTTLLAPDNHRLAIQNVRRADRPKFDCFYVYPTVSDQPTPLATRAIDPELRSIALYQAARYSRYCRVFAPAYRQLTLSAIGDPAAVTPELRQKGYADVREAWLTYLRRYNRGRGIVLIGHSQGTFVLRELVKKQIDRRAQVRRRLISALLLGGNVTVEKGRDRGGDFRNIRACRAARQLGCVVAFSTFNAPVPADARFGRTAEPGLEVLCTNPAALGGGTGLLDPLFPSAPFAPGSVIGTATLLVRPPIPRLGTAWVGYPGSYRARCSSSGGASVLQIEGVGGAPALNPVPDAGWGLHLVDANIALGNLGELVRRQGRAYLAQSDR